MNVVVLGAGVVGVAAAWFLRDAGHDVRVIERQPGAGLETSFANGGQISVSHAEPWANPGALRKIVKWLGRDDAPLLFRLRADPQQWLWGLQFLLECLPGRNRANIRRLVRLGLYSRAVLQSLRRETGIEYAHLACGILHLYTEPREFEAAARTATLMRELGVDRVPKSPDECVAIEPALAGARAHIAGGTYAASDESGDAHVFTRELAARCERRGVQLRYETSVQRLVVEGDRVAGVQTDHGIVRGDAYVVALGSYSPRFLRPLGVPLAIYPAKGYSVTLPVLEPAAAWTVSLSDEAHKLVFSRLGEQLRIAGTAELTGYDTTINAVRCRAILERTLALFPRAGDASRAEYWAGLRPATPGNVPYVGRTRYGNLFLDTGHGTLGWTHACGSGRIIADLVSGKRPEVDLTAIPG